MIPFPRAKPFSSLSLLPIDACAEENGNYQAGLWDAETGEMIGRVYEWELETDSTGWQYYKLPSPVALKAGKRYIAGVTNGSNGYSVSWSGNFFTSTMETGSLMTYKTSGRWRDMYINGAGFPDLTTASHYFRDVVCVADTELFFELSIEEKPPAVGWLNCGRFLSKIYKLTT